MIGEELAYHNLSKLSWKGQKWSKADLSQVFEKHANSHLLILLSFSKSGFDMQVGDLKDHIYLRSLKNLFEMVQDHYKLEGDILLSLHDVALSDLTPLVPILSFTKQIDNPNPILIPDPYYLDNIGYKFNFEIIDKMLSAISEEERELKAYWRGSSTGFPLLSPSTWQENPRVKLCLYAKKYPHLLDARISRLVQTESGVENIQELNSILCNWEPLERNLAFKLGIDIDGNACAWGLFQKLYMNLAIIKIKSQWMQWYYPLLEDKKNILYSSPDLEDLEALILDLIKNQDLIKELSFNARQLAKDLDYTQALFYTGTMLRELFS